MLGLMMARVVMNGMRTGTHLGGMSVVNKPYDNSANSISLVGVDLGALSSPKRFESVKMNPWSRELQ